VALRAFAEDLEDQHRAIGDGDAEVALEVALLRRRERLVEQHGFGAVAEHERLDLVGLAGADEERGVGRLAAADDALDDFVARRFGELRQLVERIVEARDAEIDADQDRACTRTGRGRFDRRGRVGAARGLWFQVVSGVSAVWKFTARPGTTVEIACL
jgi:hypothetical protein